MTSSTKKVPSPLSIRLSWDERASLEREAGGLSLTAHVRSKLFDGTLPPAKRTRKSPPPPIDYVMLGKILGLLGKSELASSLCLLAVAAESGSLPVEEHTEAEIKAACAHVAEMRLMLIAALGVKPQASGGKR